MSILADLYQAVNTGQTLQQAIDAIIPGADLKFWERKLANYDPNAPRPKPHRSRRSSRKASSKRTFRADSVLALSTTQQAEVRARATTELVERVNNETDPETVEVTTPTGGYQILEVRRNYQIPGQLESRPILWQFGGQTIELEVA